MAENGSVSKQFQPSKLKAINEEWNKTSPSSMEGSTFTPFKAATLSRINTQTETGTLRPPNKPNPFVYDGPANQSTPRMSGTLGRNSRPGSAMTMSREQKLTWGRLPQSAVPMRPATSLGQNFHTMRPTSRQSEAGMGHCIGSRYQSYCTLPRPEQLDAEQLMHEGGYPQPMIISRPPSAVPMGPIDFMRPPSAFGSQQMLPPMMTTLPPPMHKFQQEFNMVKWNTLTLLCCTQIIFSLGVFGLGVGRMLSHAKWAFGLEIFYSFFVILAAFIGLLSIKIRSYAAAAACYVMNTFSVLLAIPTLVLGMFPFVSIAFPDLDASLFLNPDEPSILDISLTAVVAVQIIVSIWISVSGCRAIGTVASTVEELRLRMHVNQAFQDSPIPMKK